MGSENQGVFICWGLVAHAQLINFIRGEANKPIMVKTERATLKSVNTYNTLCCEAFLNISADVHTEIHAEKYKY